MIMENQHRIITGYRDLSVEEIALMNEIKQAGYMLESIAQKVERHVAKQYEATSPSFKSADDLGLDKNDEKRDEAASVISEVKDTPEEARAKSTERNRLNYATPGRWSAIGKTHLQEGLMALTRAVAQPGTF